MTDPVPKERQTAYQRYEMASLGAEVPPAPEAAAVPPVDTEAILAQAREEIAAAREQAKREGLAEGLAQGYQVGMEQGREQARNENILLQHLATAFGAEIAEAKERVAGGILALSLDIAKAMLKSTLAVKSERVLPVITDAIGYLPVLQQPAMLYLHPDDAALVRERMSGELPNAAWKILDDAAMEPGGCRIETATNQVDASTPTRWQRIAASLGKESQWLE